MKIVSRADVNQRWDEKKIISNDNDDTSILRHEFYSEETDEYHNER